MFIVINVSNLVNVTCNVTQPNIRFVQNFYENILRISFFFTIITFLNIILAIMNFWIYVRDMK